MKSSLIILAVLIAAVNVSSQRLIDDLRPSTFPEGTSVSLFASKEMLSYSVAALYSVVGNDRAVRVSLAGNIYDNIEYTELPDPSLPVSASNIPYVSSVVSLASYSLYTAYSMKSGRLAWSIGQRSTLTPIEKEYITTAGILGGIGIEFNSASLAIDIENLFSTAYYSEKFESMSFPERGEATVLFNVLDGDNKRLDAGIRGVMSHGDRTDLRFISGTFSFDRSMIIEYSNGSFAASSELFGREIGAGISYMISQRLKVVLKYSREYGMNMIMTGIKAEL